jgi:hypothetical protein
MSIVLIAASNANAHGRALQDMPIWEVDKPPGAGASSDSDVPLRTLMQAPPSTSRNPTAAALITYGGAKRKSAGGASAEAESPSKRAAGRPPAAAAAAVSAMHG